MQVPVKTRRNRKGHRRMAEFKSRRHRSRYLTQRKQKQRLNRCRSGEFTNVAFEYGYWGFSQARNPDMTDPVNKYWYGRFKDNSNNPNRDTFYDRHKNWETSPNDEFKASLKRAHMRYEDAAENGTPYKAKRAWKRRRRNQLKKLLKEFEIRLERFYDYRSNNPNGYGYLEWEGYFLERRIRHINTFLARKENTNGNTYHSDPT